MAKIKISKEEIRQMIKEEYFKKLTEIKLKNRLQQINEEMKQIVSEDMEEEGLEEVKAGGKEKVRSTAWTGEKGGDEKFGAEFTKKGSHLIEDEEVSDEVVIDEPADEESLEGDLNIDAILAKLADAIEDKIETTVDEKVGSGQESSDEKIPDEETPGEDLDEVKPAEEGCKEEEGVVKEQDGTPIVNAEIKPKPAVPFEDKADVPKKDQLVSESTLKRMQILSGIRPNDFNE